MDALDALWSPLWLSLKVAGWASLLATLLGTAVGWLLARGRFPGRNVLDTLLTLPMVLPPTVLGYYLLVLLGRHGPLGRWLAQFDIRLIFTWQGAVLAATVVAFPLVFKPARAAFEAVDGQLEQAARVLGVSAAMAVFLARQRCRWPGAACWPALLLAFARAMGEFGATLDGGGQYSRQNADALDCRL